MKERPPEVATSTDSTSRWLPYQRGETIGTEGSEFGEIMLDDELAEVGRVTLERLHSPHVIMPPPLPELALSR